MIRDPRGFDQGVPRWCTDQQFRTVVFVDVTAPADSDPIPPTSVPTPPPTAPPDRIVGGVAALVARRLGVDPLWVRVAFVLLALAGGIGLLLYGGLWLALIAGPQYGWRAARIVGGVVLVAGIPIVLNAGDFELLTGPVAVVLLLVGLALALWQPRPSPWPARRADADAFASEPAVVRPERVVATPDVEEPEPITPRSPPSPLGRSALGLAIAVAAIGALIDQANGGRLHPEQWLGAAAVVCGVGLLIAAFVGRGRWLIVPALLFALVGYGAGHIARVGVDSDDLFGDQSLYIGERTPGGTTTLATGIGTLNVHIDGVPDSTYTIDARVGLGTIHIFAASTVPVLVDARVDEGEIRVDGREVEAPVRLGPTDEDPLVVIDARVGRGEIEISTFDALPPMFEETGRPPIDVGSITPVAEAVGVTDDGWFVLADGSAVIDAEDVVLVGEQFDDPPGVTVIVTPAGEFRLLPRGLLFTPWMEVLDLHAIRDSLGITASTTVPATVAPATTVTPTTEATPPPATPTTSPATPTTGGTP